MTFPQLDVGYNVRELGGYQTPDGLTQTHRFLRSGDMDTLTSADQRFFLEYGVRRDLDLRSEHEVRRAPDLLAKSRSIAYRNVELFSFDLHDPRLVEGAKNAMAQGYLTMLSNHEAVRDAFRFFASAGPGECVLFHCAAGMDRTGVTSMLVLGLCGVSREDIIFDYMCSYATPAVARKVAHTGQQPYGSANDLRFMSEVISETYDHVIGAFGSVRGYLEYCGVTEKDLDAVRAHLLQP